MTTQTEHPHIVRSDKILGCEPIVKGTRTPVRSIVNLWRQGLIPEEIVDGLPHVSLAQVFDALSYYADHPEEIDHFIELNRISEELLYRPKRRRS